MSDKMRPIAFDKMISWIMNEFRDHGSIFGIHQNKFYQSTGKTISLFGERLASPIGVAAGPHSQLAQNIVTAYLTGSRFIELKTVQTLDGEDLPVAKPCINALDECYNVEWSTELRVPEAFDEYIKAWFILHVLMKELNISNERDFLFNMSVGYDLDGIKSDKINDFIDGLKNATHTLVWKDCLNYLTNHLDQFKYFTKADLEKISPIVCTSITLSTLHGCPPQEIERIATYLLTEKRLHTFIKMNPTLLGEQFVKETLDNMGYNYITLNGHHFIHDLQYPDACNMLTRLKGIAKELQLELGVKLTNTLPVKILNNELPGEEMYMSGRSLYPLTISLANRLAKDFKGDLLISYSGGADYFNIDKIYETGIKPITFATTVLKPGGYERIMQMAKKVENSHHDEGGINCILLDKLAKDALMNKYHLKELRKVGSRKVDSILPLYDCAISPCSSGCPIHQQIPKYLALLNEKSYEEAFKVIVNDNTAPFITGTICDHKCQTKCTRLDYDEAVSIREMKRIAAINAQDQYIENIKPVPLISNKKVAVIGAGPAGLAVAQFLRRNGMDVTVLEKREKPYGIVEYVIPDFRIDSNAIKKDFELVKRQGVHFIFGVNEKFDIKTLKSNYDYVVIATGAWVHSDIPFDMGKEHAINALSFLESYKANNQSIELGKHVCVIGGGNVAMDAARAAKRVEGVKGVTIIYRRTKEYMPADAEEIELALKEGIEIKELLSPLEYKENQLICEVMELGERDASLRRRPVATGETVTVPCDQVIVAVGEKIDIDALIRNGIELTDKKFPKVNESNETNIANVYVAGDVSRGPKTVVEAIADGKKVALDILGKEKIESDFKQFACTVNEDALYEKKGVLTSTLSHDARRCLECNSICELCVDVCPNRANMVIQLENKHQILHIDGMCNECGNCGIFCPHTGKPYKDKITVFWSEKDFYDSTNTGFYVLDQTTGESIVRLNSGEVTFYDGKVDTIPQELVRMIKACIDQYTYIL